MILVLGIPDSGKSYLAEKIAVSDLKSDEKVYIATMIPFGKEGEERVKKHRKLREGKGFFTIEEPVHVSKAAERLGCKKGGTCLLECVSNLVGNAMHGGIEGESDSEIVDFTVSEIMKLDAMFDDLIVVTNSFPPDGEGYDADTVRYVQILDKVNGRLRDMACVIYEFADGEWIKQGRGCGL